MATDSTSNLATQEMPQGAPKSPPGFRIIGRTLYPGCVTPEILEQIGELEIRDDDVWIATYPKSGTRWCYDIVSHIQENKSNIEKASSLMLPLELNMPVFTPPKSASDPSLNHRQVADWDSPRVIRTHLDVDSLPRQIFTKNAKVIYVMRNPRDTIVSNFEYTMPKSVLAGATGVKVELLPHVDWKAMLHAFLEGKLAYGLWADHVKGYWQQRMEPNFLVLTFEDMKKDPHTTVRQIAKFLGIFLSEDKVRHVVEATSFDNIKKRSANSAVEKHYRKGKIGDWRNQFTVAENEVFEAKITKMLEGTDINLQWTE